MNRIKLYGILILIITTSTLFAQNNEDSNFVLSKKLTVFHNVLKEINLLYLDSVDNALLIDKAIEGMLTELDPYTEHIYDFHNINFDILTKGEYAGIGVNWYFDTISNEHCIRYVYEDAPAMKAGLQIGDLAIAINDKPTKDMSFGDFINEGTGEPNTKVKITVKRYYAKTPKILNFNFDREVVKVDRILYESVLDNNIGYIYLLNFAENTDSKVREAIDRLLKKNIKGLIIDIRRNPGGLIKQSVKTANLFLPNNLKILETKGRIPEINKSYSTTKEPIAPNLPLAVYIDSETSATAEIFAGILQDLDRAVIVGTPTKGKGIVQKSRDLGFGEKLKLSTAKFYTPSGRAILNMENWGKIKGRPKFETKNGREIIGNSGIIPDLHRDSEKISPFALTLMQSNKITYFANWYCMNNKDVKKTYVPSAKTFNQLIEYLKTEQDFFASIKNPKLETLKKEYLANFYHKEDKEKALKIISELDDISKIKIEKEIERHKDDIRTMLREEIMGHTFGIKERNALIIKKSPVIKEMAKLLANKKKYNGILNGTIPLKELSK